MGGTPVQTTTDYKNGFSNEGRLIYRAGTLDYIAGLGYDMWDRQINGAGGYTEKYEILYGKLGVGIHPNESFSIGAGVKQSLSNTEKVALFGATITPGSSTSLYIDANYQLSPEWKVSGYYDSWRFKASGLAATNIAGVWVQQPKSDMDSIGIRLSYSFK